MRKVKVNLTRYVATEAGLRYCPAVITSNGRIKQDIVLVGGKEERHPEGAYYLDWRRNVERTRLSVGKNAQDALTQRERKTFELNAANHGVVLQSEQNNSPTDHSLTAAVADFLDDTKLTKKPKTVVAYTTALNYFLESCSKRSVENVERKDLLKFSAFLRDVKELHPRTVYNKFENVMSFLKAHGVRGLVKKADWPQYTEEEPEVYEQEELDTLFAACDAQERLWFEFFLMTGMREQEVMHVYWSDVNFKGATVSVNHKPYYGWTPKAYKERSIPIPEKLVRSLQVAKAALEKDKACPLVFPTAGVGSDHADFAPLTRGLLAQAWDANSSESCISKSRFISSIDFPVGRSGRIKTQAHSEQPQPPKLCPSTHTNLRDELSWPL